MEISSSNLVRPAEARIPCDVLDGDDQPEDDLANLLVASTLTPSLDKRRGNMLSWVCIERRV
jgi:hypothetical protein